MTRRSTWAEAVTLLAFCGFLLFFGLGAFGLVGADEPRYAQIAREMLARHDWVLPVLNGKPWLEKPVLYYWEAMIAYRLFGVSDWAARIPSAFSATTMVLAIYVFWRRAGRKENTESAGAATQVTDRDSTAAALDAALITLSTAAMVGFGRAASTDMPLAANFTIAMLCWVARYAEADDSPEGALRSRWFHPRLLLFYVFLALAALAKGPVAPFLAGLIILVVAVLRRDSDIVRDTLWWPGVVVFFAIAAPWYWLVEQRTGNFFRFFFLEQNLQRYGTNVYRHPQPFWYYVPITLLAIMPWAVYGVCGLVKTLRRIEWRRGAAPASPPAPGVTHLSLLDHFLLTWAILPVIFFSFSGSKLPGYILPAVPAWTLLAALWIARAVRLGQHATPVLVLLHSAICGGIVAGVVVAPYRVLRVPVGHTALVVAIVAGGAIFAGMTVTLLRRGPALLRFVTLVPVVIAVAYLLRVDAPALDAKLSARPIAQEIAKTETQPVRVAVLHVPREVEYGLNFYRNQAIDNYDRAEIPTVNHLVVARAGSEDELIDLAGGRRVVRLGDYAPQHLEFFWVANQPGMKMDMH